MPRRNTRDRMFNAPDPTVSILHPWINVKYCCRKFDDHTGSSADHEKMHHMACKNSGSPTNIQDGRPPVPAAVSLSQILVHQLIVLVIQQPHAELQKYRGPSSPSQVGQIVGAKYVCPLCGRYCRALPLWFTKRPTAHVFLS